MRKKENIKIINWLKFKWLYFAMSATLIVVSIVSLVTNGVIIGLEFRGGSELTIESIQDLPVDEMREEFVNQDIEVVSIQRSGEDNYVFRFGQVDDAQKAAVLEVISSKNPEAFEQSFQIVGPSIGPELIKKTFFAVAIAAITILGWVAYQFKSIKFGVSAILAMLHDSFILIGSISVFGALYGAEVDFLFITAVLTTLSFSVHDTIVVFDRIREIQKGQSDITKIANQAVTETMRRSIINSLTIIFMLAALVILGGVTIRWFAASLLVGAILGTYSSPFVAVPLLATWEKMTKK